MGGDPVVGLRSLWLNFVAALCLVGGVVLVLRLDGSRSDLTLWAGEFVALVGIVALVAVRRLHRQPLRGDTPHEIASNYFRTFFLGVAMSEAVALAAFGLFTVTGAKWLYALGLTFALAGLGQIVPDRDEMARRQEELAPLGGGRFDEVLGQHRPGGARGADRA